MSDSDWSVVDAPIDSTLHDVHVHGKDTYAVGSDGVVAARRGGTWDVLVPEGPTGNGNTLYGLDLTDDGRRLWFVGDSGIIGEYDLAADRVIEHNIAQNGNTYHDVSVSGSAGDANVCIVDGSGEIHHSASNGEEDSWHSALPGSGAAVKGIDFYDGSHGYAADGDGAVFRTDDGKTWQPTNIESADVSLHGIESNAKNDVWLSGDEAVLRYDGDEWHTTEVLGESLYDIKSVQDGAIVVGGGGKVAEQSNNSWSETQTPTGETLHGVDRGEKDVIVGSSGIVLERQIS